MKFKRIIAIVMDSVGIGWEEKSKDFFNAGENDVGSNTWLHISQYNHGLNVPTLNSLGLNDLDNIIGTTKVEHKNSYIQRLFERSKGKDTLTGHWEMMGINTTSPLITFTETGFPKELIEELETKTGRKVIGNYSSSGTVILTELGEQAKKDGSLIVYTSADSVLQIAAHTSSVPLEELYKDCQIARDITMKKEWKVGRVIARPFIGEDKDHFKRTSERRDYSLQPSGETALVSLQKSKKHVTAIGKIHDIFAGVGMDESYHIESNSDGMRKTIECVKNQKDTSLIFVNLCDFDVLYGHRRDVKGYAKCIEEFDEQLKELLNGLNDDDLLFITADHGNDPTWYGTDHTRESVPLISYSKSFKNGKLLSSKDTFACIGQTILANFKVKPSENQIGEPIRELLENKA